LGTATVLLTFSLLIANTLICFDPFLIPWGDFTRFVAFAASQTPSFLAFPGVKFFCLPRYPLLSLALETAQLAHFKKIKLFIPIPVMFV